MRPREPGDGRRESTGADEGAGRPSDHGRSAGRRDGSRSSAHGRPGRGIVALAGSVRRRSRRRPGGRAFLASVAVHVVLGAVLVFSGLMVTPVPDTYRTIEVNLVSPAAAQEAPEPARATPAPEEEPEEEPEPEPEPEPTPAELNPEPEPSPPEEPEPEEPEPEPEPQPQPEAEPEEEPEPSERAQTAKSPNPEPDSASGGEGVNVSIRGEEFPFPGYLNNIITQIHRYFRWNGRSDLEAEFAFVIHRDGSVSDLRVLQGSGDVAFDYEAMGAIEQAARRGAFGPLPDGFEGDRLPISFYFQPPR